MTLYQLGDEYLRQAHDLEDLISSKRQRLEKASGIRAYELSSQIVCLREMERELRLTGQTLKCYYADKPAGRIYHAQVNFSAIG